MMQYLISGPGDTVKFRTAAAPINKVIRPFLLLILLLMRPFTPSEALTMFDGITLSFFYNIFPYCLVLLFL